MYSFGWCWIFPKLALEMVPEVFWVHVRGLGRPAKDLNVVVLKPLCSQSRHVFGVIILLKVPLTIHHLQLFKTFLNCILQNFTVLNLIHVSLHLYELSHSIPPHTMRFPPPPCLTVGDVLSDSGSPFSFQI